ncbi:glycosyltransferase [Phreatobacter sp.]|uniref:glycosyltransferase n=1 Tax=Phreatobacter sp. TaxID=1966341 RepID=UPI0022CAB482|nr:glycosyltransferase [Phreatobacter sp.]MCZ8314317.1 glycosyltransferase [Phreatobacter sp.]
MSGKSLLFIAPASPAPDGNGLAMRAHMFLTAYAAAADVDLAVVPVAGAAAIDPRAGRLCRRAAIIGLDGVDSHFALVRAVADDDARLAAFARYGAPSITAPLTAGLRARLAAFAGGQAYDLVHVSRTYLGGLADPWVKAGARLILDCDEADGDVLRAIARLERRGGSGAAAAWTMLDAGHHDGLALRVLPRFGRRFASSHGEARRLTELTGAEVTTVSNPAPRLAPLPAAPPRPDPLILLVGTMNYAPNVDGAIWFARTVLPRIRRGGASKAKLLIVGRRPADPVLRLRHQCGVEVVGSAPDLRRYYRRAALVVAPLRAGGGTRIKLLEAAVLRRPVVATAIGAEGLGLRHGRDLMLANDADGFARACLVLLRQPQLAQRLTRNAAAFLQSRHDSRIIGGIIRSSVGLGGGQ